MSRTTPSPPPPAYDAHLTERLDYWNVELGADGDEEKAVEKIIRQGKFHAALKSIRFCGCGLTDMGMKHIARELKRHQFVHNITMLDFSQNRLTFKSVGYLAAAFLENVTLHVETLSLAENSIGFHGMEALAALYSNSTSFPEIQTLNMTSNSIGDDGVKIFVESILARGGGREMPLALKSLVFGDNRISDSGVASICKLIQVHPLKKLDLVENKITDAGARALLAMVKKCPSITQVLLLGNAEIEDETTALLKKELNSRSIATVPADSKQRDEDALPKMRSLYERMHAGMALYTDEFYSTLVEIDKTRINSEKERFEEVLSLGKNIGQRGKFSFKNTDVVENYVMELQDFQKQIRRIIKLREQVAKEFDIPVEDLKTELQWFEDFNPFGQGEQDTLK